jgi:hypothetical protein
VPTASDTSLGGGGQLAVYDALCDDRLDASLWYNPSDYAARVSGGAAELTVDAANLEPYHVRGHFQQEGINVAAGANRVTTLSALASVPSATAAITGGAQIRASVRLIYSPPSLRLQYPAPNLDLLVMEVGLVDLGGGLNAFRRAFHCDDGACVTTTSTGLAIVDPVGVGSIGSGLAGAPASYDTAYRITASLDEGTGIFHWSVSGGPEFVTSISGTADPAAYLAATPGWSVVSPAATGFQAAQLTARALDSSLLGGGSGKFTARYDDVQVGLDNNPPAPWDDFGGTAPNSGPTELSLARWNGVGAPRVLPTGTGSFGIHEEVTSVGAATSVLQPITLSNPETVDVIQADVSVPSFSSSGGGTATAMVAVQGRFVNDGTSGVPAGSAVGDVIASVSLSPAAATPASWSLTRCTNASCAGGSTLGSGAFTGVSVGTGVHAMRLGFDPSTDDYTFGIDTVVQTVHAPPGAGFVAPPKAPMKRILGSVNPSAVAGTTGTLDVRVNNVLVGSAVPPGPPPACSGLDPAAVASVDAQLVAADPPAPAGGTIVDGNYRLTAVNVFTGASGATGPAGYAEQFLLSVSGTSWEMAQRIYESTGVSGGSAAGTLSRSGTNMVRIQSCPARYLAAAGFTAAATELRVYSLETPLGVPMMIEQVFTKN